MMNLVFVIPNDLALLSESTYAYLSDNNFCNQCTTRICDSIFEGNLFGLETIPIDLGETLFRFISIDSELDIFSIPMYVYKAINHFKAEE